MINIFRINSEAALDGFLLGLQSTKEHAMRLTYYRAAFIRFGNGIQPSNHPLYAGKAGFDKVYQAMNKRAEELGFGIYTFGYRKPLDIK